jgi:Domain of unknown function (DUF4253)
MEFPYPIYRVPGSQAFAKLQELRARGEGVALILGNPDEFEEMVWGWHENKHVLPEEWLERARDIDPFECLKSKEVDYLKYGEIAHSTWPFSDVVVKRQYAELCFWQPSEEVIIGVFPALELWMTPCYFYLGLGDRRPFFEAHEHAALLKFWAEKYGAALTSIECDEVRFSVLCPPRTRSEALELAWQHWIYCLDLTQNIASVEDLAAALLDAPEWYFWWD